MKTDYSFNVFKELKDQGKKIDFLFIDHVPLLLACSSFNCLHCALNTFTS